MRVNGRAVWWWCWLGVLVASCSQSVVTSSRTQPATLTLLSLTRPPMTPTATLWLLRTPTPRPGNRMVTTLAPTPLPLPISPPDCYETPVGGLWCLGLVRNRLLVPIDQVVVRIYLVTADGMALAQREASMARSLLLPGEESPYGVLFEQVPEHSAGPVAVLVQATRASLPPTRLPAVEVRNLRSEEQGAAYHVTGDIFNLSPIPVGQLGLVVTLLDSRERVTGFRQLQWPLEQVLAPGESLPFALDVIPQGLGTARLMASAEGRPG